MSLSKYILLVFGVLVFIAARPRGNDYQKIIKKEFKMDPSGKLSIGNQHGTVNVVLWDENKVEFEIVITVNAKNREEADEQLDLTTIEFEADGNNVKATTVKDEASKKWKGWKGWISNSWSDGASNYSVDYTVKTPCVSMLSIYNKHGNINLPALDGDVKINLKYGNLKGDAIAGDLDLTLKYGDAKLSNMRNLKADIGYAKLRMTDSEQFTIVSKYSKIYTNKIGDAKITSKYDKYRIGQAKDIDLEGKYDEYAIDKVNNLSIEGKYSDYEIGFLKERVEADLSYSNLNIEKLDPSFSKADLEGSYTDFDFNIPSGMSYSINLQGDYTDISYPKETIKGKDVRIDKHESSIKGYYGASDSEKRIKIDARYGSIDIDD